MTPSTAIDILSSWLPRAKPDGREALEMAIAALRDDIPSKLREIASTSTASHVAIELIPGETEIWVAWTHGGPMTSAPTAKECLEALEEKVKPK